MNERDSEALACLLEEHGYIATDREDQADIILLNTCSVRETAESKAIGKAGILIRLKRRNPQLILAVLGCMAQNLGEELLTRIPHLDAVVGTDRLHRLPQILRTLEAGGGPLVEIDADSEFADELSGHRPSPVSAYVSVMRGCDQHCSYCIVPRVRGSEKSRPAREIVQEVAGLAAGGCPEIILLGQNITAYGLAEARRQPGYSQKISPFADLLQELDAIDRVRRLRFTSPHPRYMNDHFIKTVLRLGKVCESFHIPLQSGSDSILRAMRRGYTADDYRTRIAGLRRGLPEATFSTDIIVGFPGETEADFQATRELMEEVGFDMAYVFKYSPRRGTRAAAWPDNVPGPVKEERNRILLDDMERRTRRRNRHYVGRTLEVLAEGASKRNPQRWSGRSRENKVCLFEPLPELRPGQLTQVCIERTTGSSLFGRIAQPG